MLHQQKKVMIELLNALAFFSEKWGNLLGTSTKVIIEEAKMSDRDVQDKTVIWYSNQYKEYIFYFMY